jgi:hypothetical protein
METFPLTSTFIVRVTLGGPAGLSGVVERPRTGEKHRFDTLEALGVLIARMLGAEPTRRIKGSQHEEGEPR